jgi:hypothetical protein
MNMQKQNVQSSSPIILHLPSYISSYRLHPQGGTQWQHQDSRSFGINPKHESNLVTF